MRVNTKHNGALCIFLLYSYLLLAAAILCSAEEDKAATYFEVVGSAECADCKDNNFKPSHAYLGLGVTIDCKFKTGEVQRFGAGELDGEGNFRVSVPQETADHECYAQLHSAAQIPCPAHDADGLKAHRIEPKSETNKLGPAGKLRFSTALCTSEFLWPFFKYPPLPKINHPWKKKFPVLFPPLKGFGHHPWFHHKPILPPVPVYKPPVPVYKPPVPVYKPPVPVYEPKPKPPSVPIYKPPVPVYKPKPKPKPPSVPIYKPPVPVYKPKPKPPSVPIYKPPVPVYKPKPRPPSVPIYKPPVLPPKKPCPPIIKPKPPVIVKPLPPPVPIYKPPVVVKPLPPPVVIKPLPPPIPTIPPLYKKPCPPLPKLPPFPKIPPKYFHHHPKFGHWPPLPPLIPHP